MKKYSYKNSGVEWLGEIPEHWKVKYLKLLTSFKTGFTPSTSRPEYYDGEYKWITIDDLNGGDVYETKNKLTDLGIKGREEKLIKKGSLLYSFKLSVGKVGFATEDMYSNEAIASFEPNSHVDLKFLYYSLEDYLLNNAKENIYGALLLNSELIKNSKLLVPNEFEQKSIAEHLNKATAKIDRIIAIKQDQLVKMGDYYDSRIHEYITKGINKSDFIDSGIDWQGEVPKHWNKEKLFRLADKIGSGGTPKSTNQDYYGGEISWIQSGDLNDSIVSTTKKTITEEALNNSSAKMFAKGTLLIAMYGATIGKLGIMGMDSATNQACCAIQVSSKLNSDFLFYLLYDMRKFLISQGYGGGQQNISQETLKQQYFYYPEEKEQIEIVNQIKDFRSKQEIIRENIKSQIKALQSYRKSLIHECVTGKKQIVDYIPQNK